MAAPVVQLTTGGSGSGTTGTLTYPASIVATDVVVCQITWLAGASLTPPTGFTAMTGAPTAAGPAVSQWAGWRLGTGGGTGISFSAGSRFSWSIQRVSGAHQTTPINAVTFGAAGATSASSTAQSVAGSSLTTTVANCLVVNVFGCKITTSAITASFAPPTGTTEDADNSSSAAGAANAASETVEEVQVSAGANTVRTGAATLSSASTIVPISMVFAVQPPASGTAFTSTLTAALSFTGSQSRGTARGFTATLPSTGSFTRSTRRNLTAAVSFTGATARRAARTFTASLNFAGTSAKTTARTFTAALPFAGTVSAVRNAGSHAFTQAFTATLTLSGTVTKSTSRSLTGTLSFAGAIGRQTRRAFTAAATFIGTLLSSPPRQPVDATYTYGTPFTAWTATVQTTAWTVTDIPITASTSPPFTSWTAGDNTISWQTANPPDSPWAASTPVPAWVTGNPET